MTKDELFNLIQRFSSRPIPATAGRHVYLWHGDLNGLRAIIPPGILQSLDLHRLVANLAHTPRPKDEAARLIQNIIRDELDKTISIGQQIVVVTGCDLLSRYVVPLKAFFQIASETTMIILALSATETNFKPNFVLPDYISFNPAASFTYLKEILGESATIEGL